MPIPLSAVISTVSILLVVLVAVVTLTITLTSGLAALRTIAQGYAHSLLTNAIQRTESIFTNVGIAGATFSNATSSRRWAWPSDDSATLDSFILMGLQNILSILASGANGVIMYYWDNTRITYTRYNSTSVEATIIRPSSYTAVNANASAQTIVGAYKLFFDLTNGARMTQQPYDLDSSVEYRFRSTSFVSLLETATLNGMQGTIAGYFVRSNNDSRGVYSEKYLTIIQPIFRAPDKTGLANIFGFLLTGFFIDDISKFLEDSRATSGTESFAIDNGGFLLGSSMSSQAPFLTETIVPLGTVAGAGCATAEGVGALSTGPNVKVCRAAYTQYPFAPLANLDSGIVFSSQLSVTIVDSYYAAAGPVQLPYPGMQVTVVLLMPEQDVIGDVVASRNTAIGVTAGLVVLAGAVNFAVVLLLLKPLSTIAERMHKASNLEDDETDASLSAMSEVCALQMAYYEMNDELNRIRSFVPQSVLQAKKKDAPSDDEMDADLESLKRSASEGGGANTGGSLSGGQNSAVVSAGVSPANRDLAPSNDSITSSLQRGSKNDRPPNDVTTSPTTTHASAPFQRSRQRPSVVPSTHAGKGSHAAANLTLRSANVTCLVVNFTGFTPALHLREAQVDKISATVSLVFDAIKAHGGVLASFHGDHFVATFNAVTRCATHAASACAAATRIRDTAYRVGFGLEPRIGIATSRCSIGNAGSADAKAFCVVGAAYQQAAVLERMVKVYSSEARGVMLSYRTCVDITTQYRVRYVDIVVLPGGERSRCTRTLIAFLRAPKNAAMGVGDNAPGAVPEVAVENTDNEWLYLVADGDKDDEFGVENEAFVSLFQGRHANAKEYFQHACSAVKTSSSMNTPTKQRSGGAFNAAMVVKSRLSELLINSQPLNRSALDVASGDSPPQQQRIGVYTDLGEYYSCAYTPDLST